MKRAVYLIFGTLALVLLMCNRQPDPNEHLRSRLAQHVGVWEGTYVYTTPSGEILDQHASRNETRLEGDTWHQQIVYRWKDGRTRHLVFTAHLREGKLVYDDPDFEGELRPISDDVALYLGRAQGTPNRRIIETIVTVDENHQTRSWQVIEGGQWTQVVAIDEHRVEP